MRQSKLDMFTLLPFWTVNWPCNLGWGILFSSSEDAPSLGFGGRAVATRERYLAPALACRKAEV